MLIVREEVDIDKRALLLYSDNLWFSIKTVSLTQHPIAKDIIKSSLYDLIAWARPLCQINVFYSLNNLFDFLLISLFLTNSSIFDMTKGLVFWEVVKPAITPFDSDISGSMYS